MTITFGNDLSVTFAGKVIYVEPGMGFAVKFNDLKDDGSEEVRRLLEVLGVRDART